MSKKAKAEIADESAVVITDADDGKYTATKAGQTLNLASSKGQLYLYYELERFDLAFYQDIAGTKIYKKENLPYDRPLDGYANEKPAAQAHDTFAGWSESKNQSAYSDSALVKWSGQTMTATKNVYPIWVWYKHHCACRTDQSTLHF